MIVARRNSPRDLVRRAHRVGPRRALRQVRRRSIGPLFESAHRRGMGTRSFRFGDVDYSYEVHRYGHTWNSERTVEVPLAAKFLNQNADVPILEVGNVMSHFRQTDHPVLDKYDDREWVMNDDIDGLEAAGRYGGLLSVSTLEHVGFDESPRDLDKLPRVLASLHRMVTDPEKVLVTLPIGYNPIVDELIRDEELPFCDVGFLQRVAKREWVECDRETALTHEYGKPYNAANAIVIGRGVQT